MLNEEKIAFEHIFKEFSNERTYIECILNSVFSCSRIQVEQRCSLDDLGFKFRDILNSENDSRLVDNILSSNYKRNRHQEDKQEIQHVNDKVKSMDISKKVEESITRVSVRLGAGIIDSTFIIDSTLRCYAPILPLGAVCNMSTSSKTRKNRKNSSNSGES